jgi:hypothetical protein
VFHLHCFHLLPTADPRNPPERLKQRMERRNILLTKDDGHAASGIQILWKARWAAGQKPAIVAPRTNQSGKGTGVADAVLS